ncbi:MAG: hypothetical protein KDA24_19820 [Deltaproteobacteria bacterium]|nr:hypothetical protein [Deltaproteobacteria bacterium]
MHRVICVPLALLLFTGCPTWGGDDDDDATSDDDDSTAADDDDDDATSDPAAPIYADEEAWFALAPGNTWRYSEVTAAVPDPIQDDLLVTVVRRLPATELAGDFSPELAALEVSIDRVFGDDETHWLGLSGTGTVVWLGTEVISGFETELIEGDGGVILRRSLSLDDLTDEEFDAAWLLADDGPTSVDSVATGEAPFLYAAGPAEGIDCLETQLERGGAPVGLQYFKPEWGLLGMEIELGSGGRSWEIEACSVCPPESGLAAP